MVLFLHLTNISDFKTVNEQFLQITKISNLKIRYSKKVLIYYI